MKDFPYRKYYLLKHNTYYILVTITKLILTKQDFVIEFNENKKFDYYLFIKLIILYIMLLHTELEGD